MPHGVSTTPHPVATLFHKHLDAYPWCMEMQSIGLLGEAFRRPEVVQDMQCWKCGKCLYAQAQEVRSRFYLAGAFTS